MVKFLLLNFLAILTMVTGGYSTAREENKGTLLGLATISIVAIKVLAGML